MTAGSIGGMSARAAASRRDPLASPDEDLATNLGSTLRDLRKARGLTLQQLADLCGLSQPFLSQLENGKAVPSLSALSNVARALGTTAHGLLAPQTGHEMVTTRAAERVLYHLTDGATVQFLGHGASVVLEPNEVTAEGGATSAHTGHAGEEWVYVIEGSVVVVVEGEEPVELGPGDSCTYAATIPHSVGAAGPDSARFLIVTSPPSY